MNDVKKQPDMNSFRHILLESVEVAFIMCNIRKRPFDVNTIGTLVSSIVPTAFVLSTAYWVFFVSNVREGALCVCARYGGLKCTHVVENNYWITYERSRSIKFSAWNIIPILEQAQIGSLYAVPKDVLLDINQIDSFGTLEAYIHFYVKLLPIEMLNNNNTGITSGSRDYLFDNRRLTKHVLKSRFRLIPEYLQAEPKIIFYPHPATHSCYGRFIPELLNQFTSLSKCGQMKLVPERHKLCALEMPIFTLVMEYLSTWSLTPLWHVEPDIVIDRVREVSKRRIGSGRIQHQYCYNNKMRMNKSSTKFRNYDELLDEFNTISTPSDEENNTNHNIHYEKNKNMIKQGANPKILNTLPDLLHRTVQNTFIDEKSEQPLTFLNRSESNMEGTKNDGQPRVTYATITKRF